ncbi:MAG TPA: bifunctional hydroxymethylpyrimidine kinase/phosphomethylpyrimidine kinase [Albitalea sp.]|nr:bifunctional hydroxymethylpyrimidine kinase/phosphomethylpyrimidine kinase [Albitalea sp.]
MTAAPAIVWSIAGTDSGGGAGLSADQRAADAFGVHLCPVVAAVTAQHSRAVTRVQPLAPDLIEAQLQALADDMPPAAIKTGLLGGAAQVRVVARWVDRLRADGPLALVVDPVLAASTGAGFADDDTLRAYRDELLPRATLVTPNRREAARLVDAPADTPASGIPALARELRRRGAQAVCVTGGDSAALHGDVLDWLDSDHAQGWLASARVDTPHQHGTGCTFASAAAAAVALGFVAADALVLAKMATAHALRGGRAAGAGAGPVRARAGFACEPGLVPRLSWDETPHFAPMRAPAARDLGLYGIVDGAQHVQRLLACGVRSIQLRIKRRDAAGPAWRHDLRDHVARSIAACRAAGAELFINDHWQLAQELGASGVHLGQEDVLALGEAGRAALMSSGLAVGVSSHSLWELARARSLAPRYVACGPVWPTLTKAMPWRAQGLHNLAWWRHMAGAPVVAIGGILDAPRVREAARCGVDGVCVVRGLGDSPAERVPALRQALAAGRADTPYEVPSLPRPSLPTR